MGGLIYWMIMYSHTVIYPLFGSLGYLESFNRSKGLGNESLNMGLKGAPAAQQLEA